MRILAIGGEHKSQEESNISKMKTQIKSRKCQQKEKMNHNKGMLVIKIYINNKKKTETIREDHHQQEVIRTI